MKRSIQCLSMLGLFVGLVVGVAEAQDNTLDEVSREATRLEGELGKYKDTAPEAGDAMVALSKLYHDNGRVFGLVRVGQRFISAHPNDPRHNVVMLQLMDGLEATSRNKELTAACRQFLLKYPKAGECPAVELRLARTLDQMTDRSAAGNAHRAIWQRQPNTELGRQHGVKAMQHYIAVNNKTIYSKSAELAEQMLNSLPAGSFATEVAWNGYNQWRRGSEHAKANAMGNKILQKGLKLDPYRMRLLHYWMGEDYNRLGQRANSVASYTKARAIKDDFDVHYRLATIVYSDNTSKPAQLKPLVDQFAQKYPTHDYRFYLQALLGSKYEQAADKVNANRMFASVLKFQPRQNNAASGYVRTIGAEPANHAAAERGLLDAISGFQGQTNREYQLSYLRYVLAFEVYRDRLKQPEKSKQILRDLVSKSPSNDGHLQNAISWLLYNAADDAQLRRELDLILEARRQNLHMSNFRSYLTSWIKSVRRDKKHKDKASIAKQMLDAADRDGLAKLWVATGQRNNKGTSAASQLVNNAAFNQFSDAAKYSLISYWGYTTRHYVGGQKRPECVQIYGRLTKMFPKDQNAAYYYLHASTDYGPPEAAWEAAQHFMKFDPNPDNNLYDNLRRVMLAADQNKNAGMVRTAFNWIRGIEQKRGLNSGYGYYIGDALLKYEMKNEAVAYWQAHLPLKRDTYDSRYCVDRLLAQHPENPAERIKILTAALQPDSDFHGYYASYLAQEYYRAEKRDIAGIVRVLSESLKRQQQRPFRNWYMDDGPMNLVNLARQDKEMPDEEKRRIFVVVKELQFYRSSATATCALLELGPNDKLTPMQLHLAYQTSTRLTGDGTYDWDVLMTYVQAALIRKDYMSAATLLTGMLSNVRSIDAGRKKQGRDLVAQSYSRMGAVGLTIDENSEIAPLLQAALYLRLGDESLAFDTYAANRALFDSHRGQVPIDLLLFVCDNHIAAGGDENHDRVEDILRTWIVANSESKQFDNKTKAQVQLLLAKNFFIARRYDIARSEYTTVMNRYAETTEAVEAEFGIGETFMSQKVYDQAEAVFEKLANSQQTEIVVRAEFLRGVLAYRRGDGDEARDIFRRVLERVPNIELANQALFNLAEVYGSEERYIDQLNLLRTVGRLGRHSKRTHAPGMPLSIVVQDADLGISRGGSKIPVRVTTEPGGDSEMVYLTSGGAGKGLFRVDVDTELGQAQADDGVLQLTGRDVIKCDYPDQFKREFRNVPLSDVDIQIASDAKFELASSKIVDVEEESFSERLEREAREADADQRRSQERPANQIKPGNPIYFRVLDPDRDISNEVDKIVVKLTAESGDDVQVALTETGAHTGVFEGTATTGELPAGALASDSAIEHSPLMAIDPDSATFWQSEPDGATPKQLTVDMKDLRSVTRAKIHTPEVERYAPVRGTLQGSYDGLFWYRLAANPEIRDATAVAEEFGHMRQRVYPGNYYSYSQWSQVANLGRNSKATGDEQEVNELKWQLEEGEEDATKAHGVIWHGKLVQERPGAVRISVRGVTTALALNGKIEMPVARGNRTVDLWLERGAHDLTIFAATTNGTVGVEALIARADHRSDRVASLPFRETDFDLKQEAAQPSEEELPVDITQRIALAIDTAAIHKQSEKFGLQTETGDPRIGNWTSDEDWVEWQFTTNSAGVYDVVVSYSHSGGGSTFNIEFDDRKVPVTVTNTGGWNNYRDNTVGTIRIAKAGVQKFAIKPTQINNGRLMELQGITLVPAEGARVMLAEKSWDFHFKPSQLRFVRFIVDEYLGEAVAINHVEVGGNEPELFIPTKEDVLSLANNDTLEIAGGDIINASYTDEHTARGTDSSRLLTGQLTATYFNAGVNAIGYDFVRQRNGAVEEMRKLVKRIDPGERFIVEIVDYDHDQSGQPDSLEFEVIINDGEPVRLTATENDNFSGIFTKEVDTTADNEEGKLSVKKGDRVYVRYIDEQNTFPGHSVPRESVVYVNEPTDAKIRVLETRIVPRPPDSNQPPRVIYNNPDEEQEVSNVAFEAPVTVEVIDPDAAKDSSSTVTVTLLASNGSTVDVKCEVSAAFSTIPRQVAYDIAELRALEEGRFIGQVIMQLGGKDSPTLVPITADMPRNLIGDTLTDDEGEASALDRTLVTRVVNLTGKDIIAAGYRDELRTDGSARPLEAKGRLISNGQLACTDRSYDDEIEKLHVGEKLFLMVTDADQDSSDERDATTVEITSDFGEKETVTLVETLKHSGIFTGSFTLKSNEKPTAGNLTTDEPVIECYFGDALHIHYVDPAASTEDGTLELFRDIPVVIGTDGLVAAFSKKFNDETLAVETKFHIAESYFELFKSHKNLGRTDEEKHDLQAGRRILREVMEDYPDPKYIPRIAYLLGQFSQELGEWAEAIDSYEMIVKQYSEHSLAPDAQYKLAQCHEESGDFDDALEAYVTLAATYPKNPLIANVMIRISDYFYKNEKYEVAAQVGEKFLEKFDSHQFASRMAFRIGQCHYKIKDYGDAGGAFDRFAKLFPDDDLSPDSMFWAGESFRMARNNREAFRRYNRCRWDFPASEAAKYARGRLALPEMIQQFEAEARSIENNQ